MGMDKIERELGAKRRATVSNTRNILKVKMAHSCIEIYLHIIFSTKERASLIKPEMENRLYSYLGGIAKRSKSTILNINGMDDHIHIVLKMHQDIALSTLMRELKSYSSGWMKKEGYHEFC